MPPYHDQQLYLLQSTLERNTKSLRQMSVIHVMYKGATNARESGYLSWARKGFLTAGGGIDFFHCLAAVGRISQCKVRKPPKYLGRSSSCICVLDTGLAQLCWGWFATHCLHLILLMNRTRGEIWILVGLLANIPLTEGETQWIPVKTKDPDGFLWSVSQQRCPALQLASFWNKATISYSFSSLSPLGDVLNWKQKWTVTSIV